MTDTITAPVHQPVSPSVRRKVRYGAAAIATAMSLIYFLIGLQAITVLENPEEQTAFGLIAGSAFLLGAGVILAFDRRWLWALGALIQIFIMYVYFDLAPERVPSYEAWGVALRVLQVPLIGALAYFAWRPEPGAEPDRA